MANKRLTFRLMLGIFNLISGGTSLLLALSMDIFAFIVGWLYLIVGISIFFDSIKFRLLFYFVILPLTGICLYSVTMMRITFGSSPPYGIDIIGFVLFAAIPIITCLGNLYYFIWYKK